MASQLGVFNKALRHLEERKLASLTENREPNRYMQDEWQDNITFCLSQGFWNHAIREASFATDTGFQTNFGYAFVFQKPTDWIQTYMVSDNEAYDPLLRRFTDQNGNWYSDITPIYVRYVSGDPDYGLNLARWPMAFEEYVAVRLAWLCAPRLKQADDKIVRVEKLMRRGRTEALSTDAKGLPPIKPPYGTWILSRAPRGSIVPLGNPFPWSD